MSVVNQTLIAPVYLDVVLGDRPGCVFLVFGNAPYRDARGKYLHRDWVESRFSWPAERDRMLTEVDRVLASGEPCDVFICPAVRHAGAKQRRRGDALLPTTLWCDLDGPAADLGLEEILDAFTVGSGQPGHRHLYVLLERPVDLRLWNCLQRALRDRLGGDDKVADNDLLRLPGTFNWKPTVPLPGEPTADKVAVTVEKAHARVWAVDELAALLGVSSGSTSAVDDSARPAITAEPPSHPLPDRVQWALNHPDATDRSGAHHRLVGACREAGLTAGQTLTVVSGYG
ncbi:MAG: RepB family DNA primase, partial [Actinobacteria bacterium]|nr:RepB family DNA primase [Actinomycetota bacterium]